VLEILVTVTKKAW